MHFRRSFVFLAVCCATPRIVTADSLAGPILGIIADLPAGALRPIRGIPGAATIGDPLDLGGGVSSIAVLPRQSQAVVVTDSGTRIVSVSPDGTLSTADSGAPPGLQPAAVGFSPSGAIAALYDSSAGDVWLKSGNMQPLDISKLPSPVRSLAVSDRAEPLIAGTLRGDTQSVFILDNANYRLVSGFAEVSDVAFIGSTADIAIADRGAKQVFVIHDPFAGNAPQAVLHLAEMPDAPIHIASAADGSLLAVLVGHTLGAHGMEQFSNGSGRQRANRRDRVFGVLNLSDQTWSPLECDCMPDMLAPLRGNAVFRLTQRIDQPLWILDADSGTAHVIFVPAVQK